MLPTMAIVAATTQTSRRRAASKSGSENIPKNAAAAPAELDADHIENHRRYPLKSRKIKNGAPVKAVSTETGKTCGASTIRAMVSDASSSAEPVKRVAGNRNR